MCAKLTMSEKTTIQSL